jgi:hypothetical protein
MKRLGVLVFAICCAVCQLYSQSTTVKNGPFGFYYGETKAEIIKAVGQGAVGLITDTALIVKTAPKPYRNVWMYTLHVSPTKGLLRIVVSGLPIDTNPAGEQLKNEFQSISSDLISVYGQPTRRYDLVKPGSNWKEPGDWMKGVAEEERVLINVWVAGENGLSLPNHIVAIECNAKAFDSTKGYVLFEYEFEGWDEFAKEQERQSVL